MHSTANDSISVVITTYNRPDYLRSSIKSVLSQSLQVQEIIVVDDCSPTPLQSVIDEFSDERIHYERLATNSGPNCARNTGVAIAKSDWVAFLDDDDEWLPEKIEKQVGALTDGAERQCIGSICSYRFLETGRDRVWGETGRVELDTLRQGNPYCGASGLIVLRDKISRITFDETLPCGQDWDIFIRLSLEGELVYLSESLFLYRRGSHDSVTLKAKNLKIDELPARLAAVYKHQQWLGERSFRFRLASQTLAYLPQKKQPLVWVREAVRLAGWLATARVLLAKIRSRLPAGSA